MPNAPDCASRRPSDWHRWPAPMPKPCRRRSVRPARCWPTWPVHRAECRRTCSRCGFTTVNGGWCWMRWRGEIWKLSKPCEARQHRPCCRAWIAVRPQAAAGSCADGCFRRCATCTKPQGASTSFHCFCPYVKHCERIWRVVSISSALPPASPWPRRDHANSHPCAMPWPHWGRSAGCCNDWKPHRSTRQPSCSPTWTRWLLTRRWPHCWTRPCLMSLPPWSAMVV